MKKSEQLKINNTCMSEYEKACKELNNSTKARRLRSCSAVVYDTKNYYILQSYSTIVAVINKDNDTLYDFLRIVYGYTHTSGMHISKFDTDYCRGLWSCSARYTAR